ncbi:hypothetical protein ACFOD4_18900 [Pseudoroseomonas globiformis]|uniref:Uncharacterized protein n=1 Tax=Teichococcus globiformis TaxID=2307229 RepID=A0ABV7G654_9PROT
MTAPNRYPAYTVHPSRKEHHAVALSWAKGQGLRRIAAQALELQFGDVSRHGGQCFALDMKRLILFSKAAIDLYEITHPVVTSTRVAPSEISGAIARSRFHR